MLLYLVHYPFIDVTGRMTMFTIDIWGDRHVSYVILLFWRPLFVHECSPIELTIDYHAARCFCSSFWSYYYT